MKYLIVTDTHIGANGNNSNIISKQELMWNRLFEIAKERNIKYILHGGDLMDNRNSIGVKSLIHIQECLYKPLQNNPDIEFHIILGNHDILYRNTLEYNSVEPLLGSLDNVFIYTKPSILNDEILMLNWICPNDEQEYLQIIKNTNAPYLLGHLELNGFNVSRNTVHQGGLDMSVFKKFKRVLSGHFHRHSVKGNITYLGTPISLSMGENDTKHGFHILDTETNELEFINFDEGYIHHHINFTEDYDMDCMPTSENGFVRISYMKEDSNNPKLQEMIRYYEERNNKVSLITDRYLDTDELVSEGALVIATSKEYNNTVRILTDVIWNVKDLYDEFRDELLVKNGITIDSVTSEHISNILDNAQHKLLKEI